MTEAQDLVVDRSGPDGAVATLLLNRPDSHNAISLGMYEALPGVLREIDDDRAVKVLVVRGAGRKSFASGADISEFREVRANAEALADAGAQYLICGWPEEGQARVAEFVESVLPTLPN